MKKKAISSKSRKSAPAWGGYVRLKIDQERRDEVETRYAKFALDEAAFYSLLGDAASEVDKVSFSVDDQGSFCCTLNVTRKSTNTLHIISSFADTWQFAFFVSWFKWAILLDKDPDQIEDAEISDAIWR